MSKMSIILPKWAKMKGIRIFSIYSYIHLWEKLSFAHPPNWGDCLQRVCWQTILDIPSTFQRPCIRTVVQQIVYLWQYVTSGLCHHSLISHLRFPTTKIGPWYLWNCSLVFIMLIFQYDAILWLGMVKPRKRVGDVSVLTESEHSAADSCQ